MTWGRNGFLAAAIVLFWLSTAPLASAAQPNPLSPDPRFHVITDPGTGLALFGYDAVAYHIDQAAKPGLAAHEARFDDRLWRFASAANKAAFEADPLVYIPLFGGHDGVSVSNGNLTKGDPANFLLIGGRVALFRTEKDRDLFAADPDIRREARENWPRVVRQLAGH